MDKNRRLRLAWNAPAVLVFSLVCVLVMALDPVTNGALTRTVFSVRRSSLLDPLTYLRLLGHVFGHADWSHLMGNLMYILLLGPMLEEKYGTSNLCFLMLATALITGIFHCVLFPGVRLLGASGVVFAMILLSSITSFRDRSIPVTFVLVAILYIGEQVYSAFSVQSNISYMAHIVGGTVGAGLGFLMNHWKMNRY